MNECTDAELWRQICLDNKKAFDTLFGRYWALIYDTAFAYLKDEDLASQIVHDIFLKIWQKRYSYQIKSFEAYLRVAARYHVYKELKARKSVSLVYIEDYTNVATAGRSQNDGEENIATVELEQALQKSLNQLPKRCREIFCLSRRSHLSNDEISKKLSISKRTVENQLTVALQYLRNVFKYFPNQT